MWPAQRWRRTALAKMVAAWWRRCSRASLPESAIGDISQRTSTMRALGYVCRKPAGRPPGCFASLSGIRRGLRQLQVRNSSDTPIVSNDLAS